MSTKPKPVVIDGVTYRPFWDWTPEYRRDFTNHMRAVGRGEASRILVQEKDYIRWLADKRGITQQEAAVLVMVQREAMR